MHVLSAKVRLRQIYKYPGERENCQKTKKMLAGRNQAINVCSHVQKNSRISSIIFNLVENVFFLMDKEHIDLPFNG